MIYTGLLCDLLCLLYYSYISTLPYRGILAPKDTGDDSKRGFIVLLSVTDKSHRLFYCSNIKYFIEFIVNKFDLIRILKELHPKWKHSSISQGPNKNRVAQLDENNSSNT
jgi:hypothetical protein